MSEDQKNREDVQTMPQQPAPAAAKANEPKDQPEPTHSFRDWASI